VQVFVKPDFDKYKAAALEIREIFAQYDPRFLAGSLDEAYLDLTPHVTDRLAAKRAALQQAEATAAAVRVQAAAEAKAAAKAAAAAARSQSKQYSTSSSSSSRSPYAKSQHANSPYKSSSGSSGSCGNHSSGGADSSSDGCATATAGDELAASSDHVEHTTQNRGSHGDQSSTTSAAAAAAAAAGSASAHSATTAGADSASSPTTAAAALPEAFDLSELFAEAAVAVAEMRARIKDKTTLTASAGVAPNFMLAKVCADQRKPNGQFCLEPRADAVMDFLQTLPVRKVKSYQVLAQSTEQLQRFV
jgi:nucleotidyltransferase/DNA polymerase involved in DNA repair